MIRLRSPAGITGLGGRRSVRWDSGGLAQAVLGIYSKIQEDQEEA